jgi:thioredoxin-like negative regulator of GroEL
MATPKSLMGLLAGVSILFTPQLNTVAQATPLEDSEPVILAQGIETLSPNFDGNGLFSIDAGKRLMSEGNSAVSSQNYTMAEDKFKDSRQLMNQLSNFYQGLASTFTGVDPVVSNSLRTKALETAELRDKSTYQLALVYRAQSKSDKAIPLLIEIVRSQNPSRELGQKAYQQLLELGFVDTPYPRTQTTGQAR